MDAAHVITGLVLAAGYSSRMGAFKPLLPLGHHSVIERVVGLFQQSGITDVVVVVGHRADEMIPIVKNLGARPVFNPSFDLGMYSSIKAGIAALSASSGGCLLLPVDIPSIRPATMEILRRKIIAGRPTLLFPTFQGRRGHPPYISRQLFDEICRDDGAEGLRAVLARHDAEAETIPVYDQGIHRDMDTLSDYATLNALVGRTDIPNHDECEAILAGVQPDYRVTAHVHKVAEIAGKLAFILNEAGYALDAALVTAGSLLHDVAKGQRDHALAGALLLEWMGFSKVASIVAHHSDLDFSGLEPDENAIVFLADKLVQGTEVVSIDERFQRTFQRLRHDDDGLRAAKGRLETTKRIVDAVERQAGKPLDQILQPTPEPILRRPSAAETDVEATVIAATESVCPVCLRRLAAERIREGDSIYLRKRCPEHGPFKTVTWRGADTYLAWGAQQAPPAPPPTPATGKGCPFECGLCPDHRQQSCCVLIEVTKRCNLSCPVCFAEAGGTTAADPALDEIETRLDALRKTGRQVNIQLSGGEPTLRDDLPQIVAMARAMGFDFVQVNTNGIRLARDESYLRRLKEAGLECVFLQFDGLTDDVYRTIRGADLFDLKIRAIDNCARHHIGVVLVPVLVPDVNIDQIGDIIRFAQARAPQVRTVHFQPITYFGRYPGPPGDNARITIPEVLRAIETQTQGAIKISDFRPGTAENPYCSFNGDFIVGADQRLTSTFAVPSSCCCTADKGETATSGDEAERARRFVARRWAAPEDPAGSIPPTPHGTLPLMKVDSFDAFLEGRKRTLCISGMAFQDAWTLDLERLRQCYIHVASGDRGLVPLCAFNLSGLDGQGLYRGAGS